MKLKMMKMLISALLIAALLMPCAFAENPSDDVRGYNPFDADSSEDGDFTEADEVVGEFPDTVQAAENPIVLPAATPLTSDPFGTGGAPAAGTLTDPFGTGGSPLTPTATPLPIATIPGNNPFESSGPASLVPTGNVMFVTVSSLKISNKAAEKARTVATVYFGDQLTVTATEGDWAQVTTARGASGFCPVSSLSQANPNTMNKQMYAQLAQVPVYRSPSTKSGRFRSLKKGDTTTMLAITSDGLWARVTDGTNTGFVPAIYLDDAPAAEGTVVWCSAASTAVMVNPDAWTQLTTLYFGQQLWLVGYVNNNTVAKIRNGKGYVAYCDVNALTTADPATLSTPVYVMATGRVLSNGTDENAKQHINVKKNGRLTLLGVEPSGNWALVKQGGRKLYIPYIFLGNERIGANYKVVVSNQDAPLYQSAQSGAAVLGTLPMGTRLNLLGGDRTTAKVTTIGDGTVQAVQGYIDIRYLRSETELDTSGAAAAAPQSDLSDIAAGFFQ